MQDATIDEMTDKFIKFATDTFSRPNAGDMLTRLKIGHIMTKMFMALGFTRTMFDSSPLRAGLVEFFGDDTLLFSMARKRKHQCSTRVAVVAATDIGDTMRLIPSYNRSDLSDCTDFEREDDDSMSMKIWEAAMATSAAPFYLPKFLKIETGKEYVDGALYANCPAETALREMKKLWPENRASLDILLSLGTGQQKKEIKLPKTVKIGGFEETVRSFHNNLDTQKLWEKFLRTEAAETVKGRLHRLNPEIKPEMGYISIYAYERMETLMNMVHDQAKLPTLGGGLKDVAINLLANLFFFEPDDENLPSAIRRSSTNLAAARDSVTLSGTIRSRLRHKSVELKSLLSKSSGFASAILPEAYATHASELPPNLHWTEISHFCEMRRKVQDNKGMFRLPVTLKGYRSPHVLAIKMNEAPERWIPISGFPVSTGELLRRIASHA